MRSKAFRVTEGGRYASKCGVCPAFGRAQLVLLDNAFLLLRGYDGFIMASLGNQESSLEFRGINPGVVVDQHVDGFRDRFKGRIQLLE